MLVECVRAGKRRFTDVRESGPVVESYGGLYDLVYGGKDYVETEKLRGFIDERAPGAKTLLDVACGTGRAAKLMVNLLAKRKGEGYLRSV